MKDIFFLSGLPRSGSTLLGSILAQNPAFHVTPTSPLLDLLCYTNESFNKLDEKYTYDSKIISSNVYKGIVKSFYENIKNDYIIDKHRGHPRNVTSLKMFVSPEPKIICTVRPIAEVICSYIKLIMKNNDQKNFVDETLMRKNLGLSVENRAKCLWEDYVSDPYNSMVYGLRNYKKNLLMVEYDEIINCPDKVLDLIYDFLGLEKYNYHKFKDIKNSCAEEKDAAWGLNNLHNIRPDLEKQSTPPEMILGSFLTNYYNQFNLIW